MNGPFLVRSRRWLVVMLLATLVIVFTSWGVRAQGGYPEPTDLYVNDYAGLLSAEDAANIESLFADLKQEHGIEATVVTIDTTGDETIESFAINLFNTWGIGDKAKNNGVLLLVAVEDREVRIEVGSGYENSQNEAMQEVINEHILPSFRNGNFSKGLYKGAQAIMGKLTDAIPSGESRPAQSSSTDSNFLENINPIVLIGGGLATLGAASVGAKQYMRYRKRRCPDCQTDMVRLDEVSDDMYLDSGQKLEELLNSIDYDIWQCPNCNYHTMHSYNKWWALSLKKCPQCNYRTVKVTSKTLVYPTYSSSGTKELIKDCQHCDYHQQETVIIPRKTRSSSGSGGSSGFSGGSSSGGGASGSW